MYIKTLLFAENRNNNSDHYQSVICTKSSNATTYFCNIPIPTSQINK